MSSVLPWDLKCLDQIQKPLLADQHILLGVCGGIACYKSLELCRLLIKAGAKVKVILTEGAMAFLKPLAFQALTGEEPHIHLLDATAEAGMGHIQLAKWADLFLISPCSANRLAHLAQGFADDLLTTVALATTAPVLVAPSMNQQMWHHPATQRNLAQIKNDGVRIIEPAVGSQACGDHGPGRALEPSALVQWIEAGLTPQYLAGRSVLVTAGPTREAFDPVRFLSNHSSGLMGYCLAQAAASAGAQVTLISGPSHCQWPENVDGCFVESANDMLNACLHHLPQDIIIGCAAVADFRPANKSSQKRTKSNMLDTTITLTPNKDILVELAQHAPDSFRVGFAAQTHHALKHAREKLVSKQLDLICANDVSDQTIGFNASQNSVTLISPYRQDHFFLAPTDKLVLARTLISITSQLYEEKTQLNYQNKIQPKQ